MKINVNNPTYQFKEPFAFCGQEYNDSKSLVEAVLDNWDEAITSFKCDEWEHFWETYVEAEESVKEEGQTVFAVVPFYMWDVNNTTNIDVLFTKVIHSLEPALQEIPYFEPGSSSVSLWNAEQFKKFFERELLDYEKEYLTTLVSNDLIASENRQYDVAEEKIMYSCHMLKEEIFKLFGYPDAEEEFHKVAFGVVERNSLVEIRIQQSVSQEDVVRAYRGVGERLHRSGEFIYQGKVCTSLDEFGALWTEECKKWSIKEWDAFIETLFKENVNGCSFRKWLSQIHEEALWNCLKDWEKEAKEWKKISGESDRSKLPTTLPEYKTIRCDYYVSGNQKEHDAIITKFEKDIAAFSAWIAENSKWQQVEKLNKLYAHIYEYLRKAIKDMPLYDVSCSAVKTELDPLVEQWKTWEEENQGKLKDMRILADALRQHTTLPSWNHTFSYKPLLFGKALDGRRILAVFACAPVEETYKKDCEAFLQLIEAGGPGCTPVEIERYIEDIFEYIYGPLVKNSEKAEEILEYYFCFLEKLSAKISETKLSDVLKGESYRNAVFGHSLIKGITSELAIGGGMDEETMEEKRKEMRMPSPERRYVDYKPFYKDNTTKREWYSDWSKLEDIEKEWIAQSKEIKKLAEEWEEYIEENYTKKSIAELHEAGKAKVKTACKLQEAVAQKEKDWKLQLKVTNAMCELFMEKRRKYEAEWDKRKAEEVEAEKQAKAFFEKAKKGLLALLALVVLIFVFSAVIKGIKSKFFTVWKVADGVLVANCDSGSWLFSTDKFLERLDAAITEDGILELPDNATRIGDIDLDYAVSAIGDKVQKLVIPEGVTETTSEFTVQGATMLTEIEFPSTMTRLLGNFSETGLKSIYAENVNTVAGSVSYGSVFSGTECYAGAFSKNSSLESVNLPKLEELEQYAFYECYSLSDVNLPAVGMVGQYAFASCQSLSSVELPSALALDYFVFENCTSLTSVSLPSAESVCLSSFYGCENLQEVFLPNVVYVYFNKALTNGKIYIGSSVQMIDFQVVPTRMENGETQNIHEKHNIEIVLDSNGTYAESVLSTLEEVARNPKEYGTVTISYEDFSAIGLQTMERNQDMEEDLPDGVYGFNGHYYQLISGYSSWEEAAAACVEKGGYMACITSAEEDAALWKIVKDKGYISVFFGLSDVATESTWVWENGEAFSYCNWCSGEPNDEFGREDYGSYYSKFRDGTWNDSSVSGGEAFLCEWDSYGAMINAIGEETTFTQ